MEKILHYFNDILISLDIVPIPEANSPYPKKYKESSSSSKPSK